MAYYAFVSKNFEHHGVLGMHWGIRRYQPYPKGQKVKGGKEIGEAAKVKQRPSKPAKKTSTSKPEPKEEPKKTIKDMTDDEIRSAVARLKLEKDFRELLASNTPKKSKKGQELITKILEGSVQNIGGQLTTYAMGTAVNKIAKKLFKDLEGDIVNPKKGQKDK